MKNILLKALLSLIILSAFAFSMQGKTMTVYKSPYCGCCSSWIELMKEKGFDVKTVMVDNIMKINTKLKVEAKNASCHTATVDGYLVMGHVNYSAIKKMLNEKADIKGLTVRGMPIGSPGMEQDNIKEAYNVLSIKHDGSTEIYEKH